jgi:hemolysin activation/secretion protein
MKVRHLSLAIVLVSGLAAGSQQDQQQPEQQPEQRKQQEQPRRPTLGPAPAPSLYGPATANTADPRKLLRVWKIFVERMDNALNEKLIEGLAKARRFVVVAARNEADAVMRGTCVSLRRMKTVHSEVYLNDMSGASIWQDSVRRPYNPPPLEAAVSETATVVLAHLSESIMQAEHR